MERQIEFLEVLESMKASQGLVGGDPVEGSRDLLPDGSERAGLNGEAAVRGRSLPIRMKKSETDAPDDTIFRDMAGFFHSGRTPNGWTSGGAESLLPLLLHAYRDAAQVRSNYPIVLLDDPESDARVAIPLGDIVDNVVSHSNEGEEREHLKHDLQRLEVVMRSLAPQAGKRFTDQWAGGTAILLDRVSASERSGLEKRLDAARAELTVDGVVLECGPGAVNDVFGAVARRAARLGSSSLRERVDVLIERLRQTMLVGDASTGEQLGIDEHTEIDAEALRNVLREAHLDNAIDEPRRRRMSEAVETLEVLQRSLEDPESSWGDESDGDDGAPFITLSGPDASASVGAVITSYRRQVARYVAALRIAELEISNLYREEKHDAAFSDFGWRDVRPEEAATFPPVVVTMEASRMSEGDRTLCLDLLESGISVKVLVLVDEPLTVDPVEQAIYVSWWARLAALAASSYGAYVMQDVAADVGAIQDRFLEGMHVDGPALFCIYAGGAALDEPSALFAGVSPELLSDLARESRVFPSFRFNPHAGTDFADRMDIGGNSEIDAPWTSGEGAIIVEDEEVRERIAITAADFAALLPALERCFLPVPADRRSRDHLPLAEWLLLSADERDRRLPVIEAVSPDGRVHSVLVSAAVIRIVGEIADGWRRLQELGGAANSFAERLLRDERARLRDEHEEERASLRAAHEEELLRASTAATEEIISNIAAGLLNMPTAPARSVAPSVEPAPKAGSAPVVDRVESEPQPTEDAPVAEPVDDAEDEDEDELSFDDPYIDTPLCTTCNECTNLNGLLFAYNADQQAVIKDPNAGTYRDLVTAAELCPVHIIHPGKPKNPDEPGLDDLLKRAQPFL